MNPMLIFLSKNNADDLTSLVFWLHNTTLWLHLMQSDRSINEACEMLGSFELIEEVINSVFGQFRSRCSPQCLTREQSSSFVSLSDE